nr:glycosyltransferase family A protein [uncultured Bacteroides sp.]
MIYKVLHALHLNNLIYKAILPFVKNSGKKKRKQRNAYNYLQKYAFDFQCSSICDNHIEDFPQYALQIIVPAYNVEKYIEECMDSIVNQQTTYSFCITVVNDGSTDNTRELLKKYESYANIKIIDQANRGLSGARNRGLSEINARYIMFVDSDDKLCKGAIEALMDTADKYNADIVEGGYQLFYNHMILKRVVRENRHSTTLNMYGFAWGKVFRAQLFRNIQFPEKYWFEDTVVSFILLPLSKMRASVSNIVYCYRKNMKGISISSKGNIKSLDSFYITRRLLFDHQTLGLPLEEEELEMVLRQIIINYRRIHTIKDRELQELIFNANNEILQTFFNSKTVMTYSGRHIHFLKAFMENNYKLYNLYCRLK